MTNSNDKKQQDQKPVAERQAPAYEAPRITRKRSLERVTLASAVFGEGGTIGGN
jgi:hypothetical protein